MGKGVSAKSKDTDQALLIKRNSCLERLKEAHLYCSGKTCMFPDHKAAFLGYRFVVQSIHDRCIGFNLFLVLEYLPIVLTHPLGFLQEEMIGRPFLKSLDSS
jgi:hypothetical protein